MAASLYFLSAQIRGHSLPRSLLHSGTCVAALFALSCFY
jgi:hypothetical protein